MRVCHVVYSHYPADPRVRRAAEALATAGYEVDVVAVKNTGESPHEEVGNVEVYRIPMTIVRGGRVRYLFQYGLFLLTSCGLLAWLHIRRRYRLIHVHSLPDFQVFCSIPERLLGVRVILDLHEAMPEVLAARFRLGPASLFSKIARVIERVSCAYANAIVVVARLRQELVVSRGVNPKKVTIITNSPDAAFLASYVPEGFLSDQRLHGRWVLVQAGGINAERDLATLVRAAGLLSKIHPVSLLLFGNGEPSYVQELARIAEAEAKAVDFRLGGWIPPDLVYRFLAIGEVGLATYERNPITELAAPNKVLESVAAGRPLVLADLRGLRAEWEGAALFYEPGNALDLAGKIQELIENPSLVARLTGVAKAVYDKSNWDHSRSELLHLYARVIGPRRDALRTFT